MRDYCVKKVHADFGNAVTKVQVECRKWRNILLYLTVYSEGCLGPYNPSNLHKRVQSMIVVSETL